MIKKVIISVLIVLLLVAGLVACNGTVDELIFRRKNQSSNFTVTYVTYFSSDTDVTVKEGECAVKPADPVHNQDVFNGWYTENGKLFDFTIPITSDITLYARWKGVIESKSVQQTINPGVDVTYSVTLSPASLTSETSIEIPASAITNTGSSSSELSITSYAIEVSPVAFSVIGATTSDNNLAVAGIDCKLEINGVDIKDFNNQYVTVTTYIVKGLSSVEVLYKGNDNKSQPIANVANTNVADIVTGTDLPDGHLGYSAHTGKLRFKTNHFSEFYVATNAEVYIEEENTALLLSEFRDNVYDGINEYVGEHVNLLKTVSYTDWKPIGNYTSTQFCGTFDGKNNTVYLSNHSCDDDMGMFDILNEATIKNLNLVVDFTTKEGSDSFVGGLASGTYRENKISNVKVYGSIEGGAYAAGITGWGCNCFGVSGNSVEMINCENYATIKIIAHSGRGYYVQGGLTAQCGTGTTTFTNCANFGDLLTDFTSNTSAYVYLGHLAGKGEYNTDYHIYIDNFTIGNSAKLEGYGINGVDGENHYFQGFEGLDTKTNTYTYQNNNPNFKKQCIGAYFGTCHFEGDSTSYTTEFPHGQ